jgi:hypothetical protein
MHQTTNAPKLIGGTIQYNLSASINAIAHLSPLLCTWRSHINVVLQLSSMPENASDSRPSAHLTTRCHLRRVRTHLHPWLSADNCAQRCVHSASALEFQPFKVHLARCRRPIYNKQLVPYRYFSRIHDTNRCNARCHASHSRARSWRFSLYRNFSPEPSPPSASFTT